MIVYTYTEARQNLASLLDQAMREGEVQIQRRDGSLFALRPEKPSRSPLDVGYIDVAISRDEIMDVLRESRERS